MTSPSQAMSSESSAMYSDRAAARNAGGQQESLASSNSATRPKASGLITYLRSVPPVVANRVRDATGVTKALLAVCFAAVTAGPVLAGYRAYELGLRPVGDTAMMALKVLDVGTANTPLIGQQTSVVDSAVRHPGPLQFWLFAPFVRIFGVQAGFAIGTALVGACFSIIVVWVAHRIGGARFATIMTAGVILLHTMFGFVLLYRMLVEPKMSRNPSLFRSPMALLPVDTPNAKVRSPVPRYSEPPPSMSNRPSLLKSCVVHSVLVPVNVSNPEPTVTSVKVAPR